ncbi:MAG: hypothetical protein WA317_00195, partial [Mycobacterium sp.]
MPDWLWPPVPAWSCPLPCWFGGASGPIEMLGPFGTLTDTPSLPTAMEGPPGALAGGEPGLAGAGPLSGAEGTPARAGPSTPPGERIVPAGAGPLSGAG